ncbi:hypothetical protein UA08_04206 [Talaromyces atroroseus]|uniref:Uncharacterized protein n=1 Tax=Talaromyces atroroseus TaxID=1441469 RepID=A0A1Q5Q8S6_TALAT|nr:hypothetical protein UA08_04206 [Talaromyces atroroseus]OKL60515.1 hypothetical protein UA08_04206 [Talaromyces atroroseus]
MPPIRTFKSAPINPHSAHNDSAQQEQTQTETQQDNTSDDSTNNVPSWTPATPTTVLNTASYPAAKPGAYAVPAPTSSSSTGTTFVTPTKTFPYTDGSGTETPSPPAPQPVSRPSPTASTGQRAGKGGIPPPPKKGEPVQPASYYAPPQGMTTATATSSIATLPNMGVQPQQQQNYYYPPVETRSASSTILGSNNTNNSAFEGDESIGQDILNTTKSWMASAGEKLAEAEEGVWRFVNSK